MRIERPTGTTLSRYVNNLLSQNERRNVEYWMLLNTDSEPIEMLNELIETKNRQKRIFAQYFDYPIVSRLNYLKRELHSQLYNRLTGILDDKPEFTPDLSFQPLGEVEDIGMKPPHHFTFGEALLENPEKKFGELSLKLVPNEKHSIVVKIHHACYYTVFVLDSQNMSLHAVPDLDNGYNYCDYQHQPETYDELKSLTMESGDSPLQIWILFNEVEPVHIGSLSNNPKDLVDYIESRMKMDQQISIFKYELLVKSQEE